MNVITVNCPISVVIKLTRRIYSTNLTTIIRPQQRSRSVIRRDNNDFSRRTYTVIDKQTCLYKAWRSIENLVSIEAIITVNHSNIRLTRAVRKTENLFVFGLKTEPSKNLTSVQTVFRQKLLRPLYKASKAISKFWPTDKLFLDI